MRYDMPAVFGPTLLPDVTRFGRVDLVSVSYTTARDAAAALVPRHFVVPDDPVVTVSRVTYADVDYLAGRGYNELTVGIGVHHPGGAQPTTGSYMPVLWVDDPAAIIAGREFMGYAKVGGTLPPVTEGPGTRSFEVGEYGTTLLRGAVHDLRPLSSEQLAGVRRAVCPMTVLGWKYIAGPGGTVDADYATRIVVGFDLTEASTGQGGITWELPDRQAAPLSWRTVAALAALPVVAPRRALVGSGSGYIDRGATLRL